MSEKPKGLSGLRIGNFKAFAETQQIPIRPLTLIYGANSSGKSSIIHSLLLANHALENGNVDVHQTRIGGDSVDLGGFSQYVHKHELERRFEWGMDIHHQHNDKIVDYFGGFSQTEVRFEIGVDGAKLKESSSQELAQVLAFEVRLDGERLMRMEREQDALLHPSAINTDHPCFKSSIERLIEDPETHADKPSGRLHTDMLFEEDPEVKEEKLAAWRQEHEKEKSELNQPEEIKEAIQRDLGKLLFSVEHFFPISLVPKGDENEWAYTYPGSDEQAIIDSFKSDYKGWALIARKLRFEIENLFEFLNETLPSRLKEMCYLGPLRFYPPRHLIGMHDRDPNWFAGGGQAWETLRRNPEVIEKVNHWLTAYDRLANPYKLVLRDLVDPKQVAPALQARLEDALGKLAADPKGSITNYVESALQEAMNSVGTGVLSEVILRDRSGTEVSHRDIGQGISQVLPVLVQAFASENRTIAVEQPELHLHPALQAELADVFIESALGEQANKFLLESHSEHLLLRIMRRIRETHSNNLPRGQTPVHPEDVAVLYVETVGSRSIVREMPLNERGELIKDWPGGFFEEGLREVLT